MFSKILITTIAAISIAASVSAPTFAATKCLDGNKPSSFNNAVYTRDSATISTINGTPLCAPATITLETFTLASTWNREYKPYTYPNMTAYPQRKFAATTITFPANKANYSQKVTVATPDKCKSIQIDFYAGAGYDQLNGPHDDDARNINGLIFNGEGTCAIKPPVTPPVTPSVTPPVTPPVASPTPVTPAETPEVLPATGIASVALPFGIDTVLGTAFAAFKRR